MSTPTWNGALDADAWKEPAAEASHRLADAAKVGDWEVVLRMVGDGRSTYPTVNSWRAGGTSWYAPLHQAAWHGASIEVVDQLLDLGAWRMLPTADGRTAYDIAVEKGHGHLAAALEPRTGHRFDADVAARIEAHLAALVESRIRPHLEIRLRHPVVAVLTETPEQSIWYPVPGMYGGFSIKLRERHLYIESWSRVAGGSGQAHVITHEGSVLVDSGFV